MARKPTRPIQLSPEDHAAVVELREELALRTGLTATLAQTVARAIGYYSGALASGRGLTASEAAAAMRERHERALVQALGDFAAALRPDLTLAGIAFDRDANVALAHFTDADEPPVLIGTGADPASADWN